jgi:hypothetical protein
MLKSAKIGPNSVLGDFWTFLVFLSPKSALKHTFLQQVESKIQGGPPTLSPKIQGEPPPFV